MSGGPDYSPAQVAKLRQAIAADKRRLVKQGRKVMGLNETCYCGSGRKYKKCCGRLTIPVSAIEAEEKKK